MNEEKRLRREIYVNRIRKRKQQNRFLRVHANKSKEKVDTLFDVL